MSEFTVFVFGLINLGILIAVMTWGLKKTVRGFFFARAADIERQISASADHLKSARERVAREEEKSGTVAADIAARKRTIALRAEEECENLVKGAREYAERLKEGAARYREQARLKAMDDVRRAMLANAFRRAQRLLLKRMDDEMKRRVMDASLGEFSGLLSRVRAGSPSDGGFLR